MVAFKSVVLLVILFFLHQTFANSRYSRLIKKIKSKLNPDVIPFGKNNEPVDLTVDFNLIDINEANVNKNEMRIEAWLSLKWNAGITWRREKFDFNSVKIREADIWTPDLVSFNGYGKLDNQAQPSLVILRPDGSTYWVMKTRIDFKCDLTTRHLAVNQTCHYKVGSWTSNGNEINLVEPSGKVDLSNFDSAKYTVLQAKVKRNVETYDCCPEPYMNYELIISFVRKSHKARSPK